jgi:beta-lactamase superfamily II metal-dependent hydrolase
MTFRLSLLPAREGDCLLVTYGRAGEHRMLVDGGRTGTWKDVKKKRLMEIGAGTRFETIVVTHIDRDHIEGVLKLCTDSDFKAEVGDFWFNAHKHLDDSWSDEEIEEFGVAQAEQLSTALGDRGWSWNAHFGRRAAKIDDGSGPLQDIALEGDLRVTLLSPTGDGLRSLMGNWDKWLIEAGLKPGQVEPPDEPEFEDVEVFGGAIPDLDSLCAEPDDIDDGVPNGSSIAFLLEYDRKTVLCGADAHPNVLEQALRRMSYSEQNPLRLDLMKVPHHGSGRNLTSGLLSVIDCTRFAISTNGSHHDHPDDVALARIVRSSDRCKTIYFNYDQPRLAGWKDPTFMAENRFRCVFPQPADQGFLAIDI